MTDVSVKNGKQTKGTIGKSKKRQKNKKKKSKKSDGAAATNKNKVPGVCSCVIKDMFAVRAMVASLVSKSVMFK